MRTALGLVALAAALAAGSGVQPSSAAFTAASANASNTFSTAADWVAPTVTITAPADASLSANATPTLSGTAGNAATDSATVTVRVYAGTAATGTPLQTLTATRSTTSWSVVPAALADGTYTIRATQSDTAGNTGTSATRSFTVDTVKPTATAITTTNLTGGTAGRLETGDSVTFTYSEPIQPTSVLSSFTEPSATVTVRFVNGLSSDRFTVLNSAGAATVALDNGNTTTGAVNTAANLVTNTVNFTSSTMTRSADGTSFTINLGTPSSTSRIVAAPAAAANMTWTPKTGPTDRAGNGLANTTPLTESDTDRDF